ncbi:ParB/RepB/Spo0J family partition protein [Noviherbaspirillum galbum]|uniref:ParB/RepB/Spo0J family partition protein n=1 Tax=Noviherbaspirillum galbum TaxID=2709383 RepID=A0A6B3SR40_9BURK|nr:ParB/RepB/Spo0J family partition protein [Noviherbaspirillum galbum]NEX60129.1 ParB/RepB/Spo0J family partition protein [Noviherbaspirillum galbum]
MASKNFERLAALTAGITPAKDPISQPNRMKTAPGAMMEVALQRDAAEAKLAEAEARVSELEQALKNAEASPVRKDISPEAIAELRASNDALKSEAEAAQIALRQAREDAERLQQEYEAKAATQVAELERELRRAKESGGALEIALDRLIEIPGRRRKLTEQEYADLKDNLTHNELASPITVRPREDGKYEIVSGHNRVAIFRELGRESIQAWPREVSDDQAEDMAFFANAMAAKLPDYAKYLGYKRFIAKHPQISQNELAAKAGISKAALSRLMQFDLFPKEIHALLVETPWLIGASLAGSLVKLVEAGHGSHVLQAMHRLASGELKTETQALAAATKASKPAATVEVARPLVYKLGKAAYAEQRLVKKSLRIEFASEEEAQAISESLKKLIESRIAALKSEK